MEKVIEVNGIPYIVKCLLGKGKGGYSYLVTDGTKEYVLKQIHHEPCDYYQFGDKIAAEEQDYKRLQKCGIPIPKLLDIDRKNERILKEYIKGKTIYEYVRNEEMQEAFYGQIKEICRKVYQQGLNIDYYPTNFVVQEEVIWYIDYECNEYMEEWNYENWGEKYWRNKKNLGIN